MKSFILILVSIVSLTLTGLTQKTPIIFVHGMLASSDTWVKPYQQFSANGYNTEELWVLDWNTLAMNSPAAIKQLDSLINHVLKSTDTKQVNLVGHSAGGGICSSYLSDKNQAKKVERYVHLASMPITQKMAVPTLNLYSADDKITGGKDYDFSNIENARIEGLDHYEIATSHDSFEKMYAFFNSGDVPTYNQSIKEKKEISISGRVVTLGENKPQKEAQINVYSIDVLTGKRNTDLPLASLQTDEYGNWGPISLDNSSYHEFVVIPKEKNKRVVHYFREPFKQDNPLVYLRTLPDGGFAGFLLKTLPANGDEACIALFSANKAIISGRDNVSFEGLDLTREDLSPASKTAIAHFIFDENADKNSSGMPNARFKALPFMSALDFMIPISDAPIEIRFNDRRFNLPRIPSSEGITVVVFD